MNVTVIVTKFLFKSTFPIPEFISSTIVSVPVVARDGAVAHLEAAGVEVVVVLHAQIHKVGVVGEEALLDGVNADHGGDGVPHDILCLEQKISMYSIS